MDRVYRLFYQQMYESAERYFMSPFPPRDFVSDGVRRAIDDVEAEMQREAKVICRPDAKVLLLTNFVQMIAVPVTFAAKVPPQQINEIIAHDIRLLMGDAKADSEGEISGHAIIDALSRNWRQLKTSDFRIWE